MQFKLLTDYEKACLEIINSIKFTAKHGHLANNLYLEYNGDLICLKDGYDKDYKSDSLKITEELMYGFLILDSITDFVEYNKQIRNIITNKNIIIDYRLLSYEDQMKVQNIMKQYNELH